MCVYRRTIQLASRLGAQDWREHAWRELCERNDRNAWCYETTDFMPDHDVVVRWRRQ